jgi:hypothetical protein
MKPSRMLVGGGLLSLLLSVVWTPFALRASGPSMLPHAADYQLLVNPGMEFFEAPYGQFQGVNCQVATGWQRFSYDGPEPCFMDTRVFASSHLGGGWVEKIEGSTSQMIVSTEPYTAGLWQRVSGLTPGVGYGFHAAMLTIFQTSAGDPNDGTMIKDVGIDPTGGTDPEALTVVWSEPDDHDLGPWDTERRLSLYAQGQAATVFIRVTSPFGAGSWPYMNQSFLDSAIFAQTPSVRAVSPAESQSTSFVVRWDNAVAAPGAKALKGYDVQWKDEAQGTWHDWITWVPGTPSNIDVTQATFAGERGHTYRFRARIWQRYTNGAHLYSPYRPDGDTRTYVQGPELVGRVLSNQGHAVSGATVTISGTAYSAVSDGNGYYRIRFLPMSGAHTVTVSHPYWLPPAPVYGVTFGPTETVILDWSLRPPDDAVDNGGFETELTGWSPIADGGVTPQVIADPVHTGHGALALGGNATASFTAGVSQTVALADSWEPALSFWYRPETTDTGDRFNVVLTVLTGTVSSVLAPQRDIGAGPGLDGLLAPALAKTYVFTPSLGTPGWQHLPIGFGPEGYLTGTVTIQLQVWNDGDGAHTTVYLDEISLGRTPGGPYRSYLPLLLRGF